MEVCGVMVNRIKLADALMQSAPNKVALKLLSVLFTDKELVNGNLSGVTTSKSEERLTRNWMRREWHILKVMLSSLPIILSCHSIQ